jgi:cbb3-type cytochrome oxidase subunit 3
MRLSDIMSGLDLSIYPQVALVIFLVVFAAVMLRLFSRTRAREFAHAAALPLEDDSTNSLTEHTPRLNGSKP